MSGSIYQDGVTAFVKSIRWHAWAAMAAGLTAGWFSRGAMRAQFPDSADKDVEAGRVPAARHGAAPRNSPTAIFLKETTGIPSDRCEELFREICAEKESRDAVRLQAVFRRWMELEDPKDLLVRLAAVKEIERGIWSGPFFEAWAAIDYKAAIAGTAKDGEFSGIRTLVALRRGEPAFLNGSLQIWDEDDSPVATALTALGRTDPELARQVATFRGGKPDNNAALINAVAAGWASQDPKAAFEWVKSLGLSDSYRTKALERIFSEWLKIDLAAAIEAFKSSGLAVGPTQHGGLDESLAVLAAPNAARSQLFNGIHLDPFLDLKALHDQLSKAPIDWEKNQFTLPPIESDGWFCTDPAKAAEDATKLPPGKTRDYLMSYICNQWADRKPEEATEYAKLHGLRPPILREEHSTEAIRAAIAAPEETFANLISPTTGEIDRSLMRLAEKWAAAEPQAAAEWWIAQPDPTGNDESAKGARSVHLGNLLGYHWARVDAIGASEWLESLPAGPRKAEVCQAMSHYLGTYSPDLAFTVSAKILEGETRMRFLETGIKSVSEKIGLPAARELLESTDLTPDERAALSKRLDEMKSPARP